MPPSATKTPPRLPATIGRYRIVARLGRGAMGVVYSARDDQLERNVALKVMTADLESDPETRARFYREAQITGKLLHRNIITVFDLGEEDGRLYLVMELLNGCTLAEFMKNGELPSLEQRLDLMIQTCEGLSSAHAKGIIHRDVKPSNLFVQTDGGLKILDFGIARLTSSSMTISGMIMGTPDYMSPEQAQGKDVDARSDIFSAAGVFYFMLTGRRPFEAAALPGVLHKVLREDPLPIREHEAPSGLAEIIAKGLQKDPAQRYQRSADMAAEIVRFKRHFANETRGANAAPGVEDAGVREREADHILEDARKQMAEHHHDRAAWLAENALVVCPGYEPALLLLAKARTSLAANALADPDDTVVLAGRERIEPDPAATVIIAPMWVTVPSGVSTPAETWTSKLRRRLHMVRKDTQMKASQKTGSWGPR